MGLGNVVATVLTKYKADTKDQEKAVKKLKGADLKRHKAILAQTEKQNQRIDAQIAGYAKLAVGIGVAVAAVKVMSKGLETLQHNEQLRAATAGVNLDRLTTATRGLVDETRILEFATKAMNGSFQLSQVEMELALSGALALRKTLGVDLPTALDKVQRAITEGSIQPLKRLGLVIKGGATDSEEGVQEVLEQLSGQVTQVGGNFDLAGDDLIRAGTSMENSMDSISESLGRLGEALSPVVELFAALLAGATQFSVVADAIGGIEYKDRVASDIEIAIAAAIPEGGDPVLERLLFDTISARVAKERDPVTFGDPMAQHRAALAKEEAAKAKAAAESASRPRRGSSFTAQSYDPITLERLGFGRETVPDALDPTFALEANAAEGKRALEEIRAITADIDGMQETIFMRSTEAQEQFEQGSMLSAVFGTPMEIDATAMALGALTQGFRDMSGAFGAGVDALITGSKSFSAAVTDSVGQSLRAMAVDMSMKAVQHGAMAIGALAIGGPIATVSAAGHFKAAASYSGGALVAGLAASQFGVNQQSRPSVSASAGGAGIGGASPGGRRFGAGPGDDQKGSSVFIIGDDYGSLSSRERKSRFRQISRRAGVTFDGDVVVNG